MSSLDEYHAYLKTDYWIAVSNAVKQRGGYRCQLCNSPFDLVAHHRTYEHRGNELKFLDDLICLCGRCHGIFHAIPRVSEKHPGMALAQKQKTSSSSTLVPDKMVLITEKNHKRLKCTKEPWHWMRLNGIDPTRKGWSKRAIGHRVPVEFLK